MKTRQTMLKHIIYIFLLFAISSCNNTEDYRAALMQSNEILEEMNNELFQKHAKLNEKNPCKCERIFTIVKKIGVYRNSLKDSTGLKYLLDSISKNIQQIDIKPGYFTVDSSLQKLMISLKQPIVKNDIVLFTNKLLHFENILSKLMLDGLGSYEDHYGYLYINSEKLNDSEYTVYLHLIDFGKIQYKIIQPETLQLHYEEFSSQTYFYSNRKNDTIRGFTKLPILTGSCEHDTIIEKFEKVLY